MMATLESMSVMRFRAVCVAIAFGWIFQRRRPTISRACLVSPVEDPPFAPLHVCAMQKATTADRTSNEAHDRHLPAMS